jgi:CRP-like cAMP-binding protein
MIVCLKIFGELSSIFKCRSRSPRKKASMTISQESLKKIEAFKGFSEKQLEKLKVLCAEVAFSENEQLFAAGEPATHLWMVADGSVDLRFEIPGKQAASARQTVSTVKAGTRKPMAEALGWSCFVPPYQMRLSAYCATATCRIIRIPKEELLKIFEEDPLMGYRFMSFMVSVVGYRFHQLQEMFATMHFIHSKLKPKL